MAGEQEHDARNTGEAENDQSYRGYVEVPLDGETYELPEPFASPPPASSQGDDGSGGLPLANTGTGS